MLFISHRTADKRFANRIKDLALARGYTERQLFLDSDPNSCIAAGADWEHALYERLKHCQALIVVCSPRWSESKWCFAELVFAKTLGKLVFPVVVEDCPLDAVVGERQAVFVFREGEAAYDRLWKSLEDHGLGPHDHRPWPPDDGDPCPYPGLVAFSERFAPVYFGRDQETAEVLETLNTMRDRGEPRLLLIHGGSGGGKSSLLRAGVLPRLSVDFRSGKGGSFAARKGTLSAWHVLPRAAETLRQLPEARVGVGPKSITAAAAAEEADRRARANVRNPDR